ncbi:phosphatase [Hydrogenimonas urashimensis]|uniref:Ppx/GppA phosphatase family protein n=1 Tax=Hydrogenimonas urashimensis TaxID=2740515 RepID=UPI0019166F49|nr:phosphatase [Hydrogenimonas urashimensis]
MHVVGIDLGSNTFRVAELSCTSLETVRQYEKIVRTADGMVETGIISDEALERIVEAARSAKAKIDFSHHKVVAVATEAVRRAKNADRILEAIRQRTGISFRVISGEKEADYTLLAVKTRLEKMGYEARDFVMVDIGGGSTELLFFDGRRLFSKSFPIGIVTVAQRYKTMERIEEALPGLMVPVEAFVRKAQERGMRPGLFVATAGTPTTVAAMKLGMEYDTYDSARVNGTLLFREDLKMQLRRLLSLDVAARRRLVGVGREDLIAAGILIFERFYELLGFDRAIVVDDGLREGVAIAECLGLKEGPRFERVG